MRMQGLNAPGLAQSWPLPSANRLFNFSTAGAFESKVLGSQACAFEMPAYALCLSAHII